MVLSGEGVIYSGAQQLAISAGDYIEFMPFESHKVENKGIDKLRFTSFWYVDWRYVIDQDISSVLEDDHLMIEMAFPTPNGPLHLGHLSGAYLVADVLKRCCELTGIDAFLYCGTYGHTNHIDKTAMNKSTSYEQLVAESEGVIQDDLERFQVECDAFLPHMPMSKDFEAASAEFIEMLLKSVCLVERVVQYPYSETSHQFISESYVSGHCPNCGSLTIGVECEHCGLYQDECKLINPFHSITKEALVGRSFKRLYLRLDHDTLDEIAAQMYGCNTASSRIVYDQLQLYLKGGALGDIPVSCLRERGVPIIGNQVLTIVMERALRSFFGLLQYSSATRHLFFCGIDNLCGSGIFMPYILRVLGLPVKQLPIGIINHFCFLDNKKFSTGTNHAIWANNFLQLYPSDLLRLYFAHIHSPTSESNFIVKDFVRFSKRFICQFIDLFDAGGKLVSKSAESRIEAGPWLKQDIAFYRELNNAMNYCFDSYANQSLRLAVDRVAYLLKLISDYTVQGKSRYSNHNALRTKIALLVFAYQCLAYCLYPLMPTLAVHIFTCLGISRDQWNTGKRSVRIIELPLIDIASIINYLCNMKREVSLA